jgi:hypothetical protein
VEFRRDLNASVDIVEQHANLLGRKGSAAPGNCVALKANNAAQVGQIIGDPVVGLGRSDVPISDLNRHFSFPLKAQVAPQRPVNQ